MYLRKLLRDQGVLPDDQGFIIMKESVKIKPNGLDSALTKREKEVLRFISSELTNLEIARILDISLNTVKVNCTAIYRKLQVKNRDQAAIRARELNILN